MRRLVRAHADIIAVMGGDGSFHEALDGLRDEHGEWLDASKVTFALVPAGTGGDLKKTIGMPDEPRAIATFLARAVAKPVDIGVIDYVSHSGKNESRVFGNIASFGMSGLVDQVVNDGPKWLGGKVSFFLAAARVNAVYKNVPVRVFVDDELFYEGPVGNVAVANGRAFGGGMFVAPEADLHDGLFDVVVLGDMSKLENMALAQHLYRGTHIGRAHVKHTRGKVVRAEATSGADALLDIDGEAPGRLPATFTLREAAIRMLERA